MKSFVVIGLGLFGMRIARQLAQQGADVLAIDTDEKNIAQIADHVTRAAVADARSKHALLKLGVQDCDCAIVAIGTDLGTSVLVTMNLKALAVPKVICKAYDEMHCEILKKLGADQVLIPEHVVADKLASTLTSPSILDVIELSSEYGIIERKTPAAWVGKSLKELNIRKAYNVSVIAMREGDRVSVSPSPFPTAKRPSF